MATLIDSPEFTSNEVYEIQATDPVEGAASGASFSGIGRSNQPHQQLSNRTAFLKQRQDTNIGNISTLLAFMAGFAGSMQPNGYLKIPFADVSRGSILAVVQWGFHSWNGLSESDVKNTPFGFTFPTAFPNSCFWMLSQLATNEITGECALTGSSLLLETVSFSKTAGVICADRGLVSGGSIDIANSSTGKLGLTGFYWLAIGF
jgi:hypothetical protein